MDVIPQAHLAVFVVQIVLTLKGKYSAINFSNDMMTSKDEE